MSIERERERERRGRRRRLYHGCIDFRVSLRPAGSAHIDSQHVQGGEWRVLPLLLCTISCAGNSATACLIERVGGILLYDKLPATL